jgi:hypothetical protein
MDNSLKLLIKPSCEDERLKGEDSLSETNAGFLSECPDCVDNRETARWRCSKRACAG